MRLKKQLSGFSRGFTQRNPVSSTANMTQAIYRFDATVFVTSGYESSAGDWADGDRQAIATLRALYPELGHWGDLAIGSAFGSFSEDVFEISWADWMLGQRDEIFLDYCCWRQTRGEWTLGMDEARLAEASEWKSVVDRS